MVKYTHKKTKKVLTKANKSGIIYMLSNENQAGNSTEINVETVRK